jgi:aminoglycoside 6-adenylyltransferase
MDGGWQGLERPTGGWKALKERKMRTEKEMLALILETARQDERIRAVIMNGSRVNPNAPVDIFQDFDIVYIVREVAPFRNNLAWISRFGERMVMEIPEEMEEPEPDDDGGYGYLMQFTDGNRIDLGICPVDKAGEAFSDSLSVVLLDKDGLVGELPAASDRDYLPKPPTARAFADCCTEFWWVCPYVAKGLWRQEIPFAKAMQDHYVRDALMQMLRWYIGMQTDFQVNPGKQGKYFQKYLEPEMWERLLKTYSDAQPENTWQALENMCDLFGRCARAVAGRFGLAYPHEDAARVQAHLRHVRNLPRDAQEY